MSAWCEVLRELTKDFTVVYVETREKLTARARADAGFNVRDLAQDISAVVTQMKPNIGRYALVGSSLGATAVIESCRFLKKKPGALVLIAPNTEFRIPPLGLFIIRITTPYLYVIIKPIIKWYLRTFRLDPVTDYAQYSKYCNSLDAADPWKLKKAAIAFSSYRIWDALRSVSVPVLVFGASKDVLHEPENLKRMLSRMEQVRHIDLETNKRTHSTEMVQLLREYLMALMKGDNG
jgi:pimeloyl-ACP methyl ester carboxylesterase